MAQFDRYTGVDVKIVFNGITANFKSIEIKVHRKKWEGSASDADVIQRGSGQADAEVTIKGWDSKSANSATFADVAALVLSRAALTAFSWTDTTPTTPLSKLPVPFFTSFPLAGWRVDDATGGSGGADNPGEWTVKLSPNNLN